jgi:glutamate racemase
MKNDLPIGIFDSGIGGLTVANAIKKMLPKESLLYFGDTKHLPYGEKSEETIRHYSQQITQFLLSKKCKMIVIACNTASSVAYEVVKSLAVDIPVVNVIDPVVNHLAKTKGLQNIGIIGTKGTVNADVYPKKIKQKIKQCKVQSLATPLLAPMIEEGFFNDKISQTIIENYLNHQNLTGINKLILACTHYPLIHELIRDFYNNDIEIIDSASQVAKYVKDTLAEKNMLSNSKPAYSFYVSDYTDSFEKSAQYFFHEDLHLEETKLSL